MPSATHDRNLLFGILALQLDFIDRHALVAAMNAWVLEKGKPLGQILQDQHALTPDTHALLEALVQKHLALHDGNAEKSLAAISSAGPIHRALDQLDDPDVQASLGHVPAAPPGGADLHGTVDFSAGASTSGGRRFRILRPHARGGLGQVYVARDEELHREVALKEIQERHADNPQNRARFLLEAEITGGLEHPGIVPVYGLGQYDDGRPFYAMRFIKGDSLKEAISKFHGGRQTPGERTLGLRDLLGRFIDVCQAIQYAHDRGVLHRDLKPGNIMLGKYGETLVVDWGLAKVKGADDEPGATVSFSAEPALRPTSGSGGTDTLPGATLGTPQYMSPEQAAGRLDQLGPASDIYSLGATLYSLLTGKAPVEDSAAVEPKQADLARLLKKVREGDIPRPRQVKPDVPPALEAVCLKAMALKPQDRYVSPQALVDDLNHWLADEPVSAWAEPWPVRARRWMGRNRTKVTAAAAALLVGLVGLACTTVLVSQANEVIRSKNDDLTRANDRILAQNVAIKQEVDAKEKQRQLAEDRLQQSIQAVGLFAQDARQYCDDALVPGESKKDLFLVLIEHLEKQVEHPSAEATVDNYRIKAWMYHNLAHVYGSLLRYDKAREALDKGLKAADAWLKLVPPEEKLHARSHRAGLLFLMGTYTQGGDGKDKGANAFYQQALTERRTLLGKPQVERFTRGKSYTDLADSLDAAKEFEESLKLREQAHQLANDFQTFDNWCWTYHKAVETAQTYEKKQEYLTRVDEMCGKLHKQKPNNRPVLVRWAKALRELGDLEINHKKDAEGKKAYRQYAEVARKLATAPDLLEAQRYNARAWYQLGLIEKMQRDDQAARKHFEHSLLNREQLLLDYPDDPNEWYLKLDKCFSLVALGRHADAAKVAVEINKNFGVFDAAVQYRMACVYSLCIPAVVEARRPQAVTPEDEKLQEEYRERALKCLETAFRRGYQEFFLSRTDADLEPIRADPRFRAVLEKYEKK